jgi:hypothetical protein
MSMKNSDHTMGNRTSDLPACKALPQRLLRLSKYRKGYFIGFENLYSQRKTCKLSYASANGYRLLRRNVVRSGRDLSRFEILGYFLLLDTSIGFSIS